MSLKSHSDCGRSAWIALTCFFAVVSLLSPNGSAQVDSQINRQVWQQKFGVTDARWNDPDWLDGDEDGDGVKNRDEFLAGTSPFHKLAADPHFRAPAVTVTPDSLQLAFPSVPGKLYRTESSTDLAGAWVQGALHVTGDGTPKLLTVSKATGKFFRLSVTDKATQGDQVSDWAKFILGLSMDSPVTSQSSYTQASLAAALQTQNQIILQAVDQAATQPEEANAPADDAALVRIIRSGDLSLGSVTVPLVTGGTAVAGVDFAPLPASATFPAGVNSLEIVVTPLFNPARTGSATVLLTAMAPEAPGAAGSYSLGAVTTAGVTLYPAAPTAGTGLTAEYFKNSSSTYNHAANFGGATASYSFTKLTTTTGTATITYTGSPAVAFAAGSPRILQFTSGGLSTFYNSPLFYSIGTLPTSSSFTVPVSGNVPASTSGSVTIGAFSAPVVRLDPFIDFNWGSGILEPSLPVDNVTVRWSGQILPQYSQTYWFVARVDDGVRLWVDNQLVVNRWPGGGVTDSTGSIHLKAGVRYDIRMEYYENTGSAEAHLSWYSLDRAKQIIPSNRLFPTMTGMTPLAGNPPAGMPAVTSPTNPVFVIGSSPVFTLPLAANNGGIISASGLPPWLSLVNGVLTGTPPGPGLYQFTVTSTNSAGSASAVVTLEVVAAESQLTREVWTTGITGPSLSDVPWASPPSHKDTVVSAEDTATYAMNTGERLRGYFIPPATGNYYFWIAASNAAELWISNDSEAVNKVRRAFVNQSAARTWDAQTTQKSPWLSLTGGKKYYIEALHNTGAADGDNHLSIAWHLDPDGTTAPPPANGSPPAPAVAGGIIPGNALSPWDNPPTTAVPGSLYVANLQGASGIGGITGSGGAFLRVSGTSAVLQLDVSGLSSGVTAREIVSNTGQVVFNVSAQDKYYPALKTTDGGYTWEMQAADKSALDAGQLALRISTIHHPQGELSGTFGRVAGSQTPPAPPAYPAWSDLHASSDSENSRFLTQATFGPSPQDMTTVKSSGYRPWIEAQFALDATYMVPYVLANLSNDPQNKYGSTLVFNSWWKNSVTAPDQLRQRAAFALSEILVVSNTGPLNNNGRVLADYYDTLLDHCFGNFRDILKHVTLSPAMGVYLDMRANAAGSIITGVHPNENYAREILQLFSAGLYRTWPDGTLILDSKASAVPTYDQQVITGMARVFTGWNYGQQLIGGRLPTSFSPSSNYIDPMVLVPTEHELGTKTLLDNVVLPAATILSQTDTSTDPASSYTVQTTDPVLGQGHPVTTLITNRYDLNGVKDLESTLDLIMGNSATGPYICRQLIQRFVTSDPKPEYVHRVVRAFDGERNVDGIATGVRGDMKEVFRAILMDYEARSPAAAADAKFGKQREPLLRVTGPSRAFPTAPIPGSTYRQLGNQTILVTTPVPHLLTSESVGLTQFTDAAGSNSNLPTSAAYTVANTTPSYSLAAGLATVNAPGYQAGDVVALQFTSGSLGSSATYSQVANYTVQSATPTSFTIDIGNTTFGTTSGTTRTPFNFTVANVATISPAYTISGSTVSITTTSLAAGDRFYVKFTSGGLAGAGKDGTYTVTGYSGGVATLSLGTAPAITVGGICLIPRLTGGYAVTTTGGVSKIQFQTGGNHNLDVGEAVQIKILQAITGTPATGGIYTVQSVDGPNSFTVNAPSVISNGSQGTSGMAVLPLKGDHWTRAGTVVVDPSTWGVGTQSNLNQTPLNSTTVFNYFYPDYHYPGDLAKAGMTVPEFQLTNDSNTMNLTNIITQGTQTNNSGNTNGYVSFFSGSAIMMNFAPYMTPARTSNAGVPALVNELGVLLTGGNLSSTARTTISNYVANPTNFPYTTPTNTQMRDRVRAIVNLITTSAEYAIQK